MPIASHIATSFNGLEVLTGAIISFYHRISTESLFIIAKDKTLNAKAITADDSSLVLKPPVLRASCMQ